jgi:hypothetical protein
MKLFSKVTLALALTFTIGAFAAEKSLTVYSNTTLNGQKVAAGDYKVVYDINGATAQVKLLNGKKDVVATATGQVVQTETAPNETAVIRSQQPDGSSSIVEIQIAKQKSSIRFAPETSEKGK